MVIYEKNSFPKSGIFVLCNKTNDIPNIMVKDFPNYTDKSILIVGCSLVCNKTATKHISCVSTNMIHFIMLSIKL